MTKKLANNEKLSKTKLKKENYKKKCRKIYFTWHDLSFTEKGLRLNSKKIVFTIEIDGPTKALKDIEESYFRQRYAKKLYKIYLAPSSKRIDFKISNDIQKIRNIVTQYIDNSRTKKNTIKTLYKRSVDYKIELSCREVNTYFKNNKFIKLTSQILNDQNKAIAIWENNNNTIEESILFILKHKEFSYVIWENIKENRACYIFKYQNQNFSSNLKDLINFINSDLKNKRLDLFSNRGRGNQLDYVGYCIVTHDDLPTYKASINQYLRPYFKL